MKRAAALLLVMLFASDATAGTARRSKPSRSRPREITRTIDPGQVNDPRWRDPDAAVLLRVQILLDRAQFSPGEIDSRTGPNLDRALKAFQESRNLPASGTLDEPTWQALNADSAPALTPYRITAPDVSGPFTPVPKDLMAQARLEHLGYESAAEALGEQFHINPGVLQRLNPGKTFAADREIVVPNLFGPATGKAKQIIVTKSGTLQAIDESGKVIAHFPCSSGSERDPLPLGEWKINGVARNPPFHYNPNLFWDAEPSHSKAKIAPGPNNPVGVVWIDLSKKHYGIHGTSTPSTVGHTQSHGCIRLTNWDAMELASLVAPGTPALLKE
jgi:lipoprotein-anchoring transpeptidase ErfK/SrfK